MKNIYLDIDGVILLDDLENRGRGALHLGFFLSHLAYNQQQGNYRVNWLTTHCKDGSNKKIFEYLKNNNLHPYDYDLLKEMKIQPTVWSEMKTEAIDFSEDFLWFDDDASLQEREVLYMHGAEHKLIEVNLRKDKNHLQAILHSGMIGKVPWVDEYPNYLGWTDKEGI